VSYVAVPHRRARPASTPVYREFDAEATAWAARGGLSVRSAPMALCYLRAV